MKYPITEQEVEQLAEAAWRVFASTDTAQWPEDSGFPENWRNVVRAVCEAHERMIVPKVLREALELPSEEEMIQTANNVTNWSFAPGGDYARCRDVFHRRLARLLAEYDPKTIEQRVTAIPTTIPGLSNVCLDGQVQGGASMKHEYAEIYRLGLIAKLTADTQKESQ